MGRRWRLGLCTRVFKRRGSFKAHTDTAFGVFTVTSMPNPIYIACCHYNFNFFASSIPSATVPTRASIAYPSSSSFFVSANNDFSGTVKHSINSFSSSCGFGFWFSGNDMSTRTWTMFRLVLQKPGSTLCKPPARGVTKRVNGVNEERQTIKHNRTRLLRDPHKSRLLLQLTQRTLLHRLTLINQPRRHLNRNLIDRRPILLLQEQFGAVPAWLVQDRDDVDGVNGAVCGTGLTLAGFPGSFNAVGVEVGGFG